MQLFDVVRETGFAIHRYHKHGHLEKVYEARGAARAASSEELFPSLRLLRLFAAYSTGPLVTAGAQHSRWIL